MEAYSRSAIKILTVALNPSDMEFHKRKGLPYAVCVRFPSAVGIASKDELDDADADAYYKAMNEYFERDPYTTWFNRLEKPLNELSATYYANKPAFVNRAVHIDIYTPVATTPTWGNLSPLQQAEYAAMSEYFQKLMDELRPDVILISANKTVICEKLGVTLPKLGQEPYIVDAELPNGKTLVAGRNMRGTPFGGMSDAFIHERMSVIREEVDKKALNEQLYDAAFEGKLDDIKRLLHEGADPNYADGTGYTPLMLVVEEGWIECARALVDAGADVHATNKLGETALLKVSATPESVDYEEAIPGKIQCIKLLLENGADINACKIDSGNTLLMGAVFLPELLPTIFEAGANINEQNRYGQNALMWAVGNDDAETAGILLKAGADVNAINIKGESALDIARAVNADECVQLLMAHGAR